MTFHNISVYQYFFNTPGRRWLNEETTMSLFVFVSRSWVVTVLLPFTTTPFSKSTAVVSTVTVDTLVYLGLYYFYTNSNDC